MKKIIYRQAGWLSGIWALIIFVLCSTPGQYIPSANWLDLLSFDKWVHATMFFILSCLLFITAIKRQKAAGVFILILFACVLYGGSLEIMQAKFFSNRTADWDDFAANTFGCLVAMALLKKLRRYFAQG